MRKDICLIEEAKEIAKNKNKEVNCYQEFMDAFYFFVDDGEIHFGGSQSGFVIMKKGKKIVMPYEYFMDPKSKAIEIGECISF